ncbi:MAG: mannose-6-phosphate isomerase [Alistipes sp.]|nr:mannose-6-phosphate isomerase [Alistipes sp.]
MLYPLKFKPHLKERIWGGSALHTRLNKRLPAHKVIGESWEVSTMEGDISVVSNGFLAGNTLEELIEVYMGDLVGDSIYNTFGLQFPLLIKYIDAQENLSVQVHPDDRLAAERHTSYGKTEMWYVIDCAPDAELFLGFDRAISREEFARRIDEGTLGESLQRFSVKPGDAFFIPAGTVHTIGKGILVAEIQQTSDITYRIYDWDRTDAQGRGRELHTDLALEAIHFDAKEAYRLPVSPKLNEAAMLKQCPYFTSQLIQLKGSMECNYMTRDSFTLYMLTQGQIVLHWDEGQETLRCGDTLLLPACIETATLEGEGTLLEIYIE